MIIDAITEVSLLIFDLIAEGLSWLFVGIVNFIAASIEAFVGLFVSGFNLKRLERRKRTNRHWISGLIAGSMALIAASLIAYFIIAPEVMNRTITILTDDGESASRATLVIHTSSGDHRRQTDKEGRIKIPRFGAFTVTMKDPRYNEKTWAKDEIDAELTIRRTILGSGLEHLTKKLLESSAE